MANAGQNAPNHDIMTLTEVAGYLKLAEKTVLRMVHRHEIPCAKVGSQWRFMRPMIDDWLLSKMQVVPRNDLARLVEIQPESIQLSRLVSPEYVITDVKPGSKEDVLLQLIEPLTRRGIVKETAAFLSGLIKREQTVSTAIGNGVALPHLRNPSENPIPGPALIVGICREGTDFDAADGEKTFLFFILSTDSEVVHLRLMSKLTATLRRPWVVEHLKQAKSEEEVIATLIRADYELRSEEGGNDEYRELPS